MKVVRPSLRARIRQAQHRELRSAHAAAAVALQASQDRLDAERRHIEQELERVGRLESVSLLAGGIATEFNDLLTGILGNLALARMAVQRDDEVLRRVEDAEHAGEQARGLARQLLTFARGAELVRAPVWVPGILRDAAGLALQGLGVRCEFHLQEPLPSVLADAAQLRQAVQNLVARGAAAMDGAGVLEVRASSVQVGATPVGTGPAMAPGAYVLVSVTDRGPGIPAEELPRVFDLVPPAGQRPAGIGLPIAHGIIQRHGGHLVVASRPEGSTFTFYLPAGPPIAPPVAPLTLLPGRPAAAAPARVRLLVMDDDAQVRAVTYLSLVRLRYQVTLAVHGAQAIEMYRAAMWENNPFRLVFLDLVVRGGMGGEDTLRSLKALDPGACAIAVTGYTDDPMLARFPDHGFAGAIAKPYTVDDLRTVVGGVLTAARPAVKAPAA